MKSLTNILKKLAFACFILIVIITHISPSVYSEEASTDWYDSGTFRSTTYTRTLKEWEKTYQKISNVNESFAPSITNPEKGSNVIYTINAPKTGLYYLALDYEYNTTYTSNPTVDVLINNETQYNEMNDIRLDVLWNTSKRSDEDKYNRYGDELLPYTICSNIKYHEYLSDGFNEDASPCYVLLNEGENIITLNIHDDNLIVGNLYLESQKEYLSYESYINQYNNINKITKDSNIIIQAEDIYSKNDIEIKPGYYKSYTMTPNSYKSQVLNMLSGSSMSRSGTKVDYQFEVKETGLYNLSIKYLQNSLAGMVVGKNIYIDNEIPFEEFVDYLFPYNKKWTNYTIPYDIYLEKGIHTISFESTSSHIYDVLDKLYTVMDNINSMGITINTITGSSSNTQISWKITNYLPNIKEDLLANADVLDEVWDYINSLDPTTNASEVSSLKVASKALRRLAKKPNKIQNKLSELNEGSGSAYQLIGSAIGYLINQSMSIDYLEFHSDDTLLSKPNGNIFGRIWFSLKSFVYSFFDERYNIKLSDDDNTIDVSIQASSLYTNIIQEMCDDEFTKSTGIKVNTTILSNTQSIILNNATNTNPDVVLEIDSWLPYTYALRGILEDLSNYDGFDDITKDIYASNFTPLIYEEGVYGIPETQGMQLMFYRTDILESLDLSAPNTWEDVLKMLPTLQSYQMNFYHPLGADSAYKGFGTTSQFFYMFGAEVYTENGFTTSIGTEEAIEAITFMTDLFNIYNLPQQVSSFFEHFRSGTLPIGIGGIDLYLQLKYACPELAGQWGVLPIPGMLNTDTGDIERWTTTYGKCSMMFSSSTKKNQAWEFLKWWHSTETQSTYINKIKSSLGEKYLIVPANITTLDNSPWDLDVKEQVHQAAKYSRIPAITPGSYIIEREISNIWNKVVINKEIVRVCVNESIPKINRELQRKFEEFKYLKNGEIIKAYKVPMNSNIEYWIKGKEYYE